VIKSKQKARTQVIEFENVSKAFTLYHDQQMSFPERLAQLFRPKQTSEVFWALRNVSFSLRQGETIGLIGHNGSGKSTTLKLITRILFPNQGRVTVNGRISALLELGSGFHPDLTGRENIFLNGSLLGQSRAEMERKIDEIIEFSELEDFINTPVKHYSSGMYMRLGFAIAVSVDPDILITDEVLTVGDEAFQRKCIDHIYRFKQKGRTILFVSHALGHVQNLCDRALWFKHGVLMQDGDTVSVIDNYLRATNEIDRQRIERERLANQDDDLNEPDLEQEETEKVDDPHRWGSYEVEIVQVELFDIEEKPCNVFQTGDKVILRMHYLAHKQVEAPVFGIAIHHRNGIHINGPNTRFSGYPIGTLEAEGTVDYIIEKLPLLEGEYLFSVTIYDHTISHPYDFHDRKYPFRVQAATIRERYGFFYIPSSWAWQPGLAAKTILEEQTLEK